MLNLEPQGKISLSVEVRLPTSNCMYCGKPAKLGDLWRVVIAGDKRQEGHPACFPQAEQP